MSSRLRVGVVAPRFAPFRGGVETYVSSAAAALAAHGTDVTVVTQVPRAVELPLREERDGYVVERHRLPIRNVFDVPAWPAVRAACGPGRFDVLWLHSYHTPLAWLIAEWTGTPIVFTPHYHGVGHTPMRQALHHAYRPAGRRLMRRSRRVIVDTRAEADLVLRDFGRDVRAENVVVIPPAVSDPMRGRGAHEPQTPTVLAVARQEPYKRIDVLVSAVALLRSRGSSVRLVVVGDGSALDAHREQARQLDIGDAVTFTGAVDDETLTDLWTTTTIYATASEQEAFGIGLAEALMAGLPVVASDIPAHREVVRQAGAAAAARLCGTGPDAAQAARGFADAIADSAAVGGSRAARASRCSLATEDDVVGRLLDTLTAASERASV
ncbi:glycosyltransferase family 4 protein [Mycobacterium sp. C3-094]